MEMLLLYTLILVFGSAIALNQGGWNIFDITVLFVLNLGN